MEQQAAEKKNAHIQTVLVKQQQPSAAAPAAVNHERRSPENVTAKSGGSGDGFMMSELMLVGINTETGDVVFSVQLNGS